MKKPLIKIDHVVKVYHVGEQDFTALHDISLDIGEQSFMSFVGPSGSGKTTLLNLIGGLDKPSQGEIFADGVRLNDMTREDLARFRRERIGFIFQTYNLLPVYSVYENVLFPLLLNGCREAAVRRQVTDMVEKVGLGPEINKNPSQLSGGQCQRVAIARALVKNPSLVLADEPTANLDAENSHQILELMRDMNQDLGAAFIFSTHDERVTRFAQREVSLEDGRVVWDRRRNGVGEWE
ncbi:MAG: ABC transporter ATP-binding protein [Nitrospinaceae bacterium]|nr:MAG: ABC transporter ATP-binding protein [Nitrospinaceae bacterium]